MTNRLPTWNEQMHAGTPAPAPRLDRLETLWRLQSTSGRVWECVLYRVETGLELRVQTEGKADAAAMTQLVRDRDAELEVLSESWRAILVGKGFSELPE